MNDDNSSVNSSNISLNWNLKQTCRNELRVNYKTIKLFSINCVLHSSNKFFTLYSLINIVILYTPKASNIWIWKRTAFLQTTNEKKHFYKYVDIYEIFQIYFVETFNWNQVLYFSCIYFRPQPPKKYYRDVPFEGLVFP